MKQQVREVLEQLESQDVDFIGELKERGGGLTSNQVNSLKQVVQEYDLTEQEIETLADYLDVNSEFIR